MPFLGTFSGQSGGSPDDQVFRRPSSLFRQSGRSRAGRERRRKPLRRLLGAESEQHAPDQRRPSRGGLSKRAELRRFCPGRWRRIAAGGAHSRPATRATRPPINPGAQSCGRSSCAVATRGRQSFRSSTRRPGGLARKQIATATLGARAPCRRGGAKSEQARGDYLRGSANTLGIAVSKPMGYFDDIVPPDSASSVCPPRPPGVPRPSGVHPKGRPSRRPGPGEFTNPLPMYLTRTETTPRPAPPPVAALFSMTSWRRDPPHASQTPGRCIGRDRKMPRRRAAALFDDIVPARGLRPASEHAGIPAAANFAASRPSLNGRKTYRGPRREGISPPGPRPKVFGSRNASGNFARSIPHGHCGRNIVLR